MKKKTVNLHKIKLNPDFLRLYTIDYSKTLVNAKGFFEIFKALASAGPSPRVVRRIPISKFEDKLEKFIKGLELIANVSGTHAT